jgi:hypothetical protein
VLERALCITSSFIPLGHCGGKGVLDLFKSVMKRCKGPGLSTDVRAMSSLETDLSTGLKQSNIFVQMERPRAAGIGQGSFSRSSSICVTWAEMRRPNPLLATAKSLQNNIMPVWLSVETLTSLDNTAAYSHDITQPLSCLSHAANLSLLPTSASC